MRLRSWLPLLLLIGLAACESTRSTIEIRARASLDSQDGIAGILLWLDERPFSASDFAPDADGLPEIFSEIPSSGELRIRIQLFQNDELVSEGSFSIAMAEDFEWGMDIFRTASDPLESCFGCSGTVSFPVVDAARNEPGEAVWFAWGGKPRGSDIVF